MLSSSSGSSWLLLVPCNMRGFGGIKLSGRRIIDFIVGNGGGPSGFPGGPNGGGGPKGPKGGGGGGP